MDIYGNWSQICDHWLLAANLNYEKVSNFITDEEINGNKCDKGQITTNHCAMQCAALSGHEWVKYLNLFLDYFFDPSDLPLNSNRKKSSQWVHLFLQISISEGVPFLSSAEVVIIWVHLMIIRLVWEILPFHSQYVGESVKDIHL